MKKQFIYLVSSLSLVVLLNSCGNNGDQADAHGNFEAIDVTVSSEAQGKIMWFNIEEGIALDSGKVIGVIDTIPLYLKKKQAEAQKEGISSKVSGILAQIAVQEQQKKNLLNEKKRVEKLISENAVPAKQLDDINYNISIIEKQIESIRTQNKGVFAELDAMNYQIQQINDQISNCYIASPITGTVLEKYMEAGELAVPGKALFKVASMNPIILRAFVQGNQLTLCKTGTKVKVMYDDGNGGITETEGIISWISSQAEFTPKIIQTRDERQNLVYAVKISVANDGRFKIGMPAEIQFIQ